MKNSVQYYAGRLKQPKLFLLKVREGRFFQVCGEFFRMFRLADCQILTFDFRLSVENGACAARILENLLRFPRNKRF
jgi:hypothetical protein